MEERTLCTIGRFVADFLSPDTDPEKKEYIGIGSGTVTVLRSGREFFPLLKLKIIAELVAGKNDQAALALLKESGISFNKSLINPNPNAPTSWAWWVQANGSKFRHEASLPGPSDYFLDRLKKMRPLKAGDAAVFCSEHITDNCESFEPFALANEANGVRVWHNPNVRPKAEELKEPYRQNFHRQSKYGELEVMAHSDLGEIFSTDPKDIEGNLRRFRDRFTNFKGILAVTAGGEKPRIVDFTYPEDSAFGDAPKQAGETKVGNGDVFAGALFAQLLERLVPRERLRVSDILPCIATAHAATAAHMRGELFTATQPQLRRPTPRPSIPRPPGA